MTCVDTEELVLLHPRFEDGTERLLYGGHAVVGPSKILTEPPERTMQMQREPDC